MPGQYDGLCIYSPFPIVEASALSFMHRLELHGSIMQPSMP